MQSYLQPFPLPLQVAKGDTIDVDDSVALRSALDHLANICLVMFVAWLFLVVLRHLSALEA